MCRIFGFRSVMQSHVHRSLVSADNALIQQSDMVATVSNDLAQHLAVLLELAGIPS